MSPSQSEIDSQHMKRALDLAAKGSFRVHPNPMVGAVIARGAERLAEGYHVKYGELHAEQVALNDLAARDPEGRLDRSELSLYVTLEPCAHQGQQPPCVNAVLASGIRRVVIAQRDPNPKVDGRSLDILNRAGIEVVVSCHEAEARRLNSAFNKFMITERPLVTVKWAMSLDGKIAAHTGDSKWITSPRSRRRVHELRGQVDAIVVGLGTALHDNPRLTRRDVEGRDPVRVVVDSKARLAGEQYHGLHLIAEAKDHPTCLVTTELAQAKDINILRQKGLGVFQVPAEGQRVDVAAMLDKFGRRGWQHVLCEGGGQLLGSFFAHDLVDRLHCFIAPKIIGGQDAPTPAGGIGVSSVADALNTGPLEVETIDQDVLLSAQIHDW